MMVRTVVLFAVGLLVGHVATNRVTGLRAQEIRPRLWRVAEGLGSTRGGNESMFFVYRYRDDGNQCVIVVGQEETGVHSSQPVAISCKP